MFIIYYFYAIADESWIDPHARSGKAWVPKAKQFDYEERLHYSYQKHHMNRGKRIIMIHAGKCGSKYANMTTLHIYISNIWFSLLLLQAGPKGLINENAEVFEVGGKRGTAVEEADYHDNIESTFYYAWFRKLCINIKEKYGEAIIVIDNAPYHTKSDAPKSNAKKQELLTYLLEVDKEGSFTKFDQTKAGGYLRGELWQMVMEYKKGNTDHYLIDRLAKEYGQTVIR